MALTPLITELIIVFILAATVLYRYGNIFKQHVIITLAVLTAWYFSFLIIFILPLDVSSTVYRQCLAENATAGVEKQSDFNVSSSLGPPVKHCREPWSYVPENVLPNLWRVVYWTSQCLTWLLMPIMQSYIQAGDFSFRGKLKSALIDNATYYGVYFFICIILLIYIVLKSETGFDGQKIKTIASSASNTWGLFLLILLLGYALIDVPRGMWRAAKPGYSLTKAYFRAEKLHSNKCEADGTVDHILKSLQSVNMAVGPDDPFYVYVKTVRQKVPAELQERITRRALPFDTPPQIPSEKHMIKLHKQVMSSLHVLQQTKIQWDILVDKIIDLEDVSNNEKSRSRIFKHAFEKPQNAFLKFVYNPTIEWYWKCMFQRYLRMFIAIILGMLSFTVVWSEVTFFSKKPVLSIFAKYLYFSKKYYDYFTIDILSTLMIAYMCYCAYSTVLKIRVLNIYYLAPHHQTNEQSLIFSGKMLCRLTPPMCLNFLGLIHMDSHIIEEEILETYYTQIMGHMNLIPIISDGFNIYFPIVMIAICLSTYFSVGDKILSVFGCERFMGDDQFTTKEVEIGKKLIQREISRRRREVFSKARHKDFQERFLKCSDKYGPKNGADIDEQGTDDQPSTSAIV